MFDKLIAFLFSIITFFMSIFGGNFMQVTPVVPESDSSVLLSEDIKVISYNIKSGGKKDLSPQNRKDKIKKILDEQSADVMGIQEATPFWMENLPEMFGEKYDIVGVGRSDDESSEANPILYLKEKYNLIDSGTFWLSDTPDIMSNTWGASFNRICTYVVLENKQTGFRFAQFNTHFDHTSTEATEKSADLIIEKIAQIAPDLPIVLMGDFNSNPSSVVYQKLSNAFTDASKIAISCDTGKTGRTYHGHELFLQTFSGEPIDYFFVNDGCLIVEKFEIIDEKVDGIYPSDHYPLMCDLTLYSKKAPASDTLTQSVNVLTYNVYYGGEDDMSPENRSQYVFENIRRYSPDSFGLEEANKKWLKLFENGMTEYDYVGHGRDKNLGGESSPVFYLKDKYEVVKSGTFWLSKTPDKPSRGWDAMMNRVCTYAVLKDKETGFTYAHFNAHFDHIGLIARMNSVAVVSQKIAEICPNIPIVFSGDLNDSEGSEVYERILSTGLADTKHLAEKSVDLPTYNGYSESTEQSRPEPIDFIFTNAYAVTVHSYTVDRTIYNGSYASDHHPVISKITFVN